MTTRRDERALGILHLACNDPDNGNFAGRFREASITFGLAAIDDSAELAAPYAWKLVDDGKAVVIRGKRYPYLRRITWYGNWCWDAFVMERRIIRSLVRVFRESDRWVCESGPAGWCDAYDKNRRHLDTPSRR